MTAAVDSVRSALEMDRPDDYVASHLNPPASYDVADHPMPTGREEVWRFTPLNRLGALLEDEPSSAQLSWHTDLPEGVTRRSITAAQARDLGVAPANERPGALALAHTEQVTLIEVPADYVGEEPIVINMRGDSKDDVVWANLLFRVGTHAQVTFILTHEGSAQYSAVTTFHVGDGANVNIMSLQDWDDDAVHLGRDAITVGRDAFVRYSCVSFGGDLVRMHANVDYAGPGGHAEVLGLYFADAGQHLEHRLFVDHNAPHTRSNALYKGALQGQGAHTVWIGNVLIRKVAEEIETYEENRNLILTDGTQADSVPNLEIETGNIVGAGHASATARFDDEQLFYLRSRGITEKEAQRLVVHGFFTDLIRKINIPSMEERLLTTVEAELARHLLQED